MESETLVALIQTRFALKISSQYAENILDDNELLLPHPLLADKKATSATDSESVDVKRHFIKEL